MNEAEGEKPPQTEGDEKEGPKDTVVKITRGDPRTLRVGLEVGVAWFNDTAINFHPIKFTVHGIKKKKLILKRIA